MPNDTAFDEAIDRLCVLADPARRAAYTAVRAARRPVTRAEVGDAAGISARLAAFHLEKLLAEGYLEAGFDEARRVGHPAKRYWPSDLELEVSLPPRRYDLVAQMFADVLADRVDEAGDDMDTVAEGYGRRVGARVGTRRGEARFVMALRIIGYEPDAVEGDVVLRNCPFQRAAEDCPEVVCRMNRAFVEGLLAGTRTRSHVPKLDPAPDRCCVVVVRNAGRRGRSATKS
jgi:predicted ArsR family transcriptional regulator